MKLSLNLNLSTQILRGPSNRAPTDIALSASTIAEDAELGAVVGALTATDPEMDTVTFSMVDDAGGRFGISDTNLIVTGVLDFETATSHNITIRATDAGGATYDELFVITVTDVSETPPSDPPPDDGTIEDDGSFTNPPIVTVVDGGIKLSGKKAANSAGKFIYDIGPLAANMVVTIGYEFDGSLMTNLGKNVAVGFVLKTGQDFHFEGNEGDGATGLDVSEISGDGLWNSGTGWTEVDHGDPANGTQAAAFIQIEVSADGSTITYRTGVTADGPWTDEVTANVPDPFTNVSEANQFGIGMIFRANDTGSYSLKINHYVLVEAFMVRQVALGSVPWAIFLQTTTSREEVVAPGMVVNE